MKKDQNLPVKNIHDNNSSGKPLPNSSNYSRNQSTYNSNHRGRSPNQRKTRNFSQNRYSRSNSRKTQYRNNYSQSNSNRPIYLFDPILSVPILILGSDTIHMIDQEIYHLIDIEIIPTTSRFTIKMWHKLIYNSLCHI